MSFDEAVSPFRRGDRLGRYELLCPLAAGGMALVWLAERHGDKGETDLVVVKTILPEYSHDHRFQKMFLDEANIASRIRHSNVARIFEVGEEQGNYYIAMEWVDGESLARLHRAVVNQREPLPLGIVLRVGMDLCAGLEAAHGLVDEHGRALGVVHRDISPQNILLAPTGEAKIIDFGVAKARDRMAQATEAGQLKGKLRYMPPEQALGRADIDHRADLWSVGCVLYELLTDSVPFEGSNEVAVLHRLTSGAAGKPLPDTVPAALRAVLEKALAPDKNQRFAHGAAFRAALEQTAQTLRLVTPYGEVAQYAAAKFAARRTTRRAEIDTLLNERGIVRGAVSPALALELASSPGQRTLGSAVIDTKAAMRGGRSRLWTPVLAATSIIATMTVAAWKFGNHETVQPATHGPQVDATTAIVLDAPPTSPPDPTGMGESPGPPGSTTVKPSIVAPIVETPPASASATGVAIPPPTPTPPKNPNPPVFVRPHPPPTPPTRPPTPKNNDDQWGILKAPK